MKLPDPRHGKCRKGDDGVMSGRRWGDVGCCRDWGYQMRASVSVMGMQDGKLAKASP